LARTILFRGLFPTRQLGSLEELKCFDNTHIESSGYIFVRRLFLFLQLFTKRHVNRHPKSIAHFFLEFEVAKRIALDIIQRNWNAKYHFFRVGFPPSFSLFGDWYLSCFQYRVLIFSHRVSTPGVTIWKYSLNCQYFFRGGFPPLFFKTSYPIHKQLVPWGQLVQLLPTSFLWFWYPSPRRLLSLRHPLLSPRRLRFPSGFSDAAADATAPALPLASLYCSALSSTFSPTFTPTDFFSDCSPLFSAFSPTFSPTDFLFSI
jgi:hypothetical protein